MGQNWAIVVGINHYSNLQPLKYAERDAESVRDFFGELGFERVFFFAEKAPAISADSGASFSAEPTFGELSNFLDRRFEQAFLGPRDNLWFFFAGHGRREQAQDYLMLRDSNPRNLERSALKLQELAAQLRRSNAGNVILLLDACRDDGSRDGVGIGTKQQGVITFYSCAPSQLSYEIDELQAGAFTSALLQGLKLRGEDGNCATVERLASYLKTRVPALVERYKGTQQDPLLALDPDSKRDAILLPQLARSSDVQALKTHAYRAQARANREMARELWIQVLAAAPADADAIEQIERLARNDSGKQSDATTGNSAGNPSSSSVQQSEIINIVNNTHFFPIKQGSTKNIGQIVSTVENIVQIIEPSINRRRMIEASMFALATTGLALITGKLGNERQTTATPSTSPRIPQSPSPKPTVSESPQPKSTRIETPAGVRLEDFEFKTVKLSNEGKVIKSNTLQGERFTQVIAGGISLKMISIPAGTFMMGSPSNELQRVSDEGPQHQVSVPAFFMAQMLVTQAQWKAMAQLEKVKRDLTADPSKFKGAYRPVEWVSWDDATEFCARLSRETGRDYRLPSEAEWEYACRAHTTTPFYFGETITTDVANYRGEDRTLNETTYPGKYGDGPYGDFQKQTTDVGNFPANPFGLSDMHGNVLEWCQDNYHANYEGAPINNSPWSDQKVSESDLRVVRGGSWYDCPGAGRSARRYRVARTDGNDDLGFRVVCGVTGSS
jgi:formylglycine-generating enzyme required for sulfatase activity/uncharacterized caspase-like protein